ncbi:MAG: IPT/TIG domain-containing protein [Myxococcota bacterium]
MLLAAVTACLLIPEDEHAARVDEVAPSDTGTTPSTPETPTDPPTLAAVAPPFGTDAGGTVVTLTGTGFGGTPEVRFGEVLGIVQSVTADTLVVETPASTVRGDVDVTVTTTGGEAVRPASFTYWKDATGKVGATGELVWFYVVGDYWGGASDDYGRSVVRFTEGFDYQFYQNWAPALDACTHIDHGVPDWEFDPEYTAIDALDGQMVQTSPSASIVLDWNPAELRFTNYDLAPEQVVPGETYDLSLQGTLGVPAIDLPGVFRVPAQFRLTSPEIDGAVQPDVTIDQHFEWTTEEDGDAILLQLGMLSADGSEFEEEVYCALADVGSFWLTPDLFDNWTANRQLHILIGRYHSGEGLLPWNQGRIAVASQVWYYGIGRTR